jgi:hypothetical protein
VHKADKPDLVSDLPDADILADETGAEVDLEPIGSNSIEFDSGPGFVYQLSTGTATVCTGENTHNNNCLMFYVIIREWLTTGYTYRFHSSLLSHTY